MGREEHEHDADTVPTSWVVIGDGLVYTVDGLRSPRPPRPAPPPVPRGLPVIINPDGGRAAASSSSSSSPSSQHIFTAKEFGLYASIGFGVTAFIIAIAVLVWWQCRRSRARRQQQEQQHVHADSRRQQVEATQRMIEDKHKAAQAAFRQPYLVIHPGE
eukprot:scaffold6.g2682.t1